MFNTNQKRPKTPLKVKLLKTSTARPLWHTTDSTDNIDKAFAHLILNEEKLKNDVGKVKQLPSEQSYSLMKKIALSTNSSLIPIGNNTNDKLKSLKMEPATIKLLRSKSWKEFFYEQTGKSTFDEGVSMDRPKSAAKLQSSMISRNTNNGTSLKLNNTHQGINKSKMEELFMNMISRVEELWDSLKIPLADRNFYRKSLCKLPVQSLEQCGELSAHIVMLKKHQESTISTLQVIRKREICIQKCYEILSRLYRQASRVPLKDIGIRLNAPPNGGDTSDMFWKQELLCSLDELRCLSLDVIKNIQRWRRNLWRPQPFVWCDVNYLSKMKNDMNILEVMYFLTYLIDIYLLFNYYLFHFISVRDLLEVVGTSPSSLSRLVVCRVLRSFRTVVVIRRRRRR
jgi:hypothetical protein